MSCCVVHDRLRRLEDIFSSKAPLLYTSFAAWTHWSSRTAAVRYHGVCAAQSKMGLRMRRLAQDVILLWVAYTRGAADERKDANASMKAVQNDYEVRLVQAYQHVEETDANFKHIEQMWQQARRQADSCQEQLLQQNETLQSAHDAIAVLQLQQSSAIAPWTPQTRCARVRIMIQYVHDAHLLSAMRRFT